MKYARMLCLAVLAMAFTLPFFGASASATVLTSAGASYTGKISAEATDVYLHRKKFFEWGIDVTCNKSWLEAEVESHGSTVTALARITKLVFAECSSLGGVTQTTTLKAGALEFHTASGDTEGTSGNATVTHSGALEITTSWKTMTNSEHCVFKLADTDIGTLTGSKTTGATATLNVDAALTTGFSCGFNAELTGNYTVTTPDNLNAD